MTNEHHLTLLIDEDQEALMDVVFPGGLVMASTHDVIDQSFNEMVTTLSFLCRRRRDVAISGAMRWPWSQEYPLTQPKLRD